MSRTATLADVVERLSLRGGGARWAEGLDSLGPPTFDVVLPEGDSASALLARLGVDPADAAAVVRSLPSPERDPEWWWLLERCCQRLALQMGDPSQPHGGWPNWVGPEEKVPPERRCFMAHVYLAMLPRTRAWHAARGIPDDVSWASFADLGRHMAIHRRAYGATGIDASWWLSLSLRAEAFDLGRLQFNWFRLGIGDESPWWYPADEAERRGAGFRPDDFAVGIHIPENGPMEPEACGESLERARGFFARHFPVPDQARRLGTCWSWLLDDQLAQWLPADSNIVKFQRRFELVPGWQPGDHSLFEFVFRVPGALDHLDSLPQRTTLERAAVAHVKAGGQWHMRTGWLDLSS
ncbi:MAG TPA: acyltransferase domain-containing protein [Acidimicrobiales bacterium]|nr:acyltransferase domain-containing protein [Acidimicrobiales bacterium]